MAFTCAVIRCSDSNRKFTKWKLTMCEIHLFEETVRYAHVTPLSGKKEDLD